MMDDRKPSRSANDERATLRALLQYQRESFVRKVSGVDDAAARRVIVASGTTLLWLAQHMAHAEQLWIIRRFAGLNMPPHLLVETDSIEAAVAVYKSTWDVVDDIVAAVPELDTLCQDAGPPTNLRWVLSHLLEETARHAGHADILRELIDGTTGR